MAFQNVGWSTIHNRSFKDLNKNICSQPLLTAEDASSLTTASNDSKKELNYAKVTYKVEVVSLLRLQSVP